MEIDISIKAAVGPAYYDLILDVAKGGHTDYKLSGGRGSLKSTFAAVTIIFGMMNDGDKECLTNAVAFRRYKANLQDSVYEQLIWAIDKLEVSDLWKPSLSPLRLTYIPTGQVILFRGADKVKKVKSIKVSKGYIKYLWFEEVDEFEGPEKIRSVEQSALRGGPSFKTFFSFNPPKSQRIWVNDPTNWQKPGTLNHHSTYLEAPPEWLGDKFIAAAEHLKATKPEAYEHEYLGKPTGTGTEVFANLAARPITAEEIANFVTVRRGLDFGFATDPLAYVAVSYDRKKRRIFIFDELYGIRISNRKAYQEIKKKNPNNEPVYADSSEPKSIHELRQYGMHVIPVKKGPDSVDYGIKFLQDLDEIVIDPERCPNAWREFYGYELELDAQGNPIAEFPDKNNHTIDAVRYALNQECLKWREEKKKPPKDPGRLTPEEEYERMVSSLTGGRAPSIKV